MSSSADLAERVESGGFREALYYRLLEGTTIHVPPLRARPADVAVIAEARASVLVRAGQGGLHDRWDGAGC